jgi:hypothetical protein
VWQVDLVHDPDVVLADDTFCKSMSVSNAFGAAPAAAAPAAVI